MDLFTIPDYRVILASASQTRVAMLASAGIAFTVEPTAINEAAIKHAGRAESIEPLDIAILLAEMKAAAIAQQYGQGHFIIGSDQILVCDGEIISKPKNAKEAGEQLAFLSGKTHQLITAVVVFRDGVRIWHHVETPTLQMRRLAPDFIVSYLAAMGEAALFSPGSYQIEALGAHLFTKISGCHYAVLGMPLLDLLAFLREHGLAPNGAIKAG